MRFYRKRNREFLLADSLRERVFAVHLLLEAAAGHRLPLSDIGAMVAGELGKKKPFSPTSVLGWEKGVNAPSVKVVAALARAARVRGVDVDPGWLAFGSESYAPPPENLATVLSRPVLSVVRSKQERRKSRGA